MQEPDSDTLKELPGAALHLASKDTWGQAFLRCLLDLIGVWDSCGVLLPCASIAKESCCTLASHHSGKKLWRINAHPPVMRTVNVSIALQYS